MKTKTLKVPISNGDLATIRGEIFGPFLVHRSAMRLHDGWDVTLIKAGNRFPYHFKTKKEATAFAKKVCKETDWDAVSTEWKDRSSLKVVLTSKVPTAKQKIAITKLAEKMNAIPQ